MASCGATEIPAETAGEADSFLALVTRGPDSFPKEALSFFVGTTQHSATAGETGGGACLGHIIIFPITYCILASPLSYLDLFDINWLDFPCARFNSESPPPSFNKMRFVLFPPLGGGGTAHSASSVHFAREWRRPRPSPCRHP